MARSFTTTWGNARGAELPRRPEPSVQKENGQSEKLGHVQMHNDANREGAHVASFRRVAAGRNHMGWRSSFPGDDLAVVLGYRPTVAVLAPAAVAPAASSCLFGLSAFDRRAVRVWAGVSRLPAGTSAWQAKGADRTVMVGRHSRKSRVPSLIPPTARTLPVSRRAVSLRAASHREAASSALLLFRQSRCNAAERGTSKFRPLRSAVALHGPTMQETPEQCPSSQPTEEFFRT